MLPFLLAEPKNFQKNEQISLIFRTKQIYVYEVLQYQYPIATKCPILHLTIDFYEHTSSKRRKTMININETGGHKLPEPNTMFS